MNKFDKKIQEKLNNTSVTPSAGVWANIDASLTQKSSKKGFVLLPFLLPLAKYGIAAAVAFLIGSVLTFTFMGGNHESNENPILAEEEKDDIVIDTDINKEDVLFAEEEEIQVQNVYNDDTFIATTSVQDDNNGVKNESNIIVSENDVIKKDLLAYDDMFQDYEAELQAYSLSLIQEETNDYILEEELGSEPVFYRFSKKTNRVGYQGFWIGPEISYESSFSNGNYYKGQGLGLSFGYDFAKKWGIQSGVRYAMIYKNFMVENEGGQQLNYQGNLSAIHIPLMLRWKNTMVGGRIQRPTSFNIALGMDYGYNKANNFHQLGAIASVEYDIFMRSDMMLTLGARGGFSKNMNYTPAFVPEAIGEYNYQLGIYAAFRFMGAGKGK